MLSNACLTGKSRQHLVPLPLPYSDSHFLQQEVVNAFLALQKAAKGVGFNLQPASSFRDFSRQQLIWNKKFCGERKVHNDNGEALDLTLLTDWQKCEAILRWATIPGMSRHHWGTEIDIFDPDLLPDGHSLLLEPQEYQMGGYFFPLVEFLVENMEQYGFTLPFVNAPATKKIGTEYWHLSYQPLAEIAQQQMTPEVLREAWHGEEIAGKAVLLTHLPTIFSDFIL